MCFSGVFYIVFFFWVNNFGVLLIKQSFEMATDLAEVQLQVRFVTKQEQWVIFIVYRRALP